MNELITVAVAVYNAEKYLDKCINSIINQTYNNLEILLINDGSTDNSKSICEEFAKLDKRITFVDKENGGLSSVRNLAITTMIGSYLMFVDCDDWVCANIVEFLHDKIIEFDLDYSSCSGFDYYENSNKVDIVKRKGDKIFDNKEGMYDFYSNQHFTFDAIQCKLYRKKCIENITFKLNRTTDDTLTTPLIIDNCKKMGYFDTPLYNYLVREGSMTRTKYNNHSVDKVLAYYDNLDLINENYDNETYKNLIAKMYSAVITNQLKIEILGISREFSEEIKFYEIILIKYPVSFSNLVKFSKIYYLISKNNFIRNIIIKIFKKKIARFIQIEI